MRPVLKYKMFFDASIWRQEIESSKKLLPALQPRVINLSLWLQPKKPIKVGQFVWRRKGWSWLQEQAHSNGLIGILGIFFIYVSKKNACIAFLHYNQFLKITKIHLYLFFFVYQFSLPICYYILSESDLENH